MRINTSPSVLEMFKLLKILRRDIFQPDSFVVANILVSCKGKIQKFKMLDFDATELETCKKIYF